MFQLFLRYINSFWASQMVPEVKNLSAHAGGVSSIPGLGRDPLEEAVATQSSILA